MLFSQPFIMPNSGSFRIGTIGGSPFVQEGSFQNQVGYAIPPRFGLLKVRSLDNLPTIYQCRASVYGYSDNLVQDVKVPCDVLIEFPCSVVITGPSGLNLLVEAWPVIGLNTRGAIQSYVGTQTGIIVPMWATTVDFAGTSATFRDNLGAVVGVIDVGVGNAAISNFSIPTGAATVDITGVDPLNSTLIFRQV